jgi:hypothetical protein
VNARQRPTPSDDDSAVHADELPDAFAGLTPIDVVDGELVPRSGR